MTSIEQKMKEAIEAKTYTSTTGLSVEGTNNAAAECAKVAMDYMLLFGQWLTKNRWTWSKHMNIFYKTGLVGEENEKIVATEREIQELFDIYLKSQTHDPKR